MPTDWNSPRMIRARRIVTRPPGSFGVSDRTMIRSALACLRLAVPALKWRGPGRWSRPPWNSDYEEPYLTVWAETPLLRVVVSMYDDYPDGFAWAADVALRVACDDDDYDEKAVLGRSDDHATPWGAVRRAMSIAARRWSRRFRSAADLFQEVGWATIRRTNTANPRENTPGGGTEA